MTESSKELGFFFNPAGDGTHHQTEMKGKGLTWVDNIRTHPLPTRDAWLSFFLMLMPGMIWGLVVVNMAPEKLDKMMQASYFKVLPFLGVNRHITKEWQMLPERFHGLGLMIFVVLCLAAKYFPCNATSGLKRR